jgi:sugar phosphate isomerase/epimerase
MLHYKVNRRKFLKSTAVLLSLPLTPIFNDMKNLKPLLSFSTLGCPDWDFKKITDFAVENNYEGIELRGLLHEMDLTRCPEFSSPENISTAISVMKDKNLSFVDLGSSTNLHVKDNQERTKNLDEAKRFIDLASKINCPYVRVFPNLLPKDQDKNQTIDLIAHGLRELGDYAKGSNVSALVETHGDLLWTADVKKVMEIAFGPHTGLVWDVTNMWSVTKEPPENVHKTLKPYIRHTHIKDLKMVNGKERYVLLGRGEVPIFTAIDALRQGGYSGYYSFEWEKLWHPEIDAPELAIADYSKVMLKYFNK